MSYQQKIIFKTSVKEVSPYVFFGKVYSFEPFILVFNPFQVSFRARCEIGDNSLLLCEYPVFSGPVIEKTVLSPLYILLSLAEY